ncbi:MAG: hypothetical protein GY953_02920, partial [bacterium]|nr:hypothetical protein [bacterium]
RRHGHNEADDPSYTQPILYRKIRRHPSVATLYAAKMAREELVTQEQVGKLRAAHKHRFQDGYQQAQDAEAHYEIQDLSTLDTASIPAFCPHTALSRERVEQVIRGITTFPEDFTLHPKLQGFIDKRGKALDGGPVDWALAEALAFGSLVLEGTPVRVSGQDSSRGTFSQRHLDYADYENGRSFDLAEEHGFLTVGGSDAHFVSALGRCLTEFDVKVTSNEE